MRQSSSSVAAYFVGVLALVPMLCVLILHSLLRLAFLLANPTHFADASPSEIAWAHLHGIRFDLATVLLLHAPVILGGLLILAAGHAGATRRWLKALPSLLVLVNIPGLLFNIVDIAWWPFNGRRSTLASFAIVQDIKAQIFQVLAQYWFLLVGGLLLLPLLWLVARALLPNPTTVEQLMVRPGAGVQGQDFLSKKLRLVIVLVALSVTLLGIRGGLQVKPLTPTHAYRFSTTALGDLSLNSAFVVMRSPRHETIPRESTYTWEQTLEIVGADYSPPQHAGQGRPNVVLLLLESGAAEYISALNGDTPDYRGGFMPFLDTLVQKSASFDRAFANGRRSIEAVSSAVLGIPSLMETPWIVSQLKGGDPYGIPRVLRDQAGYSSAFFHGGQNGTMFFDVFANLAGFDRYVGLDEYPPEWRARDFDGHWGIFDEPFLKFAAQEMNSMPQPFFTTVFTLSSHNPYTIPKDYAGRFPKGRLPIHESIGYLDHALQQFFATAETMPWFNNTIFVVTADHTALSEHTSYMTEEGNYRVPLLFYAPKGLPPHDRARLAQHVDIPASIFDLLGIRPHRVALFGRSLFDGTSYGASDGSGQGASQGAVQGRVLNQASGQWWLLEARGKSSTRDGGPGMEDLAAWRQYFRNGVLDGKLWVER